VTALAYNIQGSSDIIIPETINPLDPVKRSLGEKQYELSNHLGNVLVTISDRKLVEEDEGVIALKYEADVLLASDYYPFGMQMPGRQFSAEAAYRYGFNGMEKDDEFKGEGNSYDFGARMYDSRIGRWLSVDPLAGSYPDLSSFCYAANSPIGIIDPDGERIVWYRFKSNYKVRKALFYTTTGKEVWERMRKEETRNHLHYTKKVLILKSGNDYGVAGGITVARRPWRKTKKTDDQSSARNKWEHTNHTNDEFVRNRDFGRTKKRDKNGDFHFKAQDIYISEGGYLFDTGEITLDQINNGSIDVYEVGERASPIFSLPIGLKKSVLKKVDDVCVSPRSEMTSGLPDPDLPLVPNLNNKSLFEYLNQVSVHEGTHAIHNAQVYIGDVDDDNTNENIENYPTTKERKTVEDQVKLRDEGKNR
jgi:RHS repeat-associated protein